VTADLMPLDTHTPITSGLVFFVRIELTAHGEHSLGHLVAHYVADRSEIAMTNQVLGGRLASQPPASPLATPLPK